MSTLNLFPLKTIILSYGCLLSEQKHVLEPAPQRSTRQKSDGEINGTYSMPLHTSYAQVNKQTNHQLLYQELKQTKKVLTVCQLAYLSYMCINSSEFF